MNELTLPELERQRDKLTNQIWAIERAAKQRERLAQVGKFYKYRNCYSCPESEADYWWLYSAIYLDGEIVKEFSFQTDSDGRIEFRSQELNCILSECIEIDRSEFVIAYKLANLAISSLMAMATK